jgi:hypothetical protein
MNLLVTAAAAAASSVALPSDSLAAPAIVDPANSDCEGTSVTAKQARGLRDESFPEYPPEIFGKLPDGFVLEKQSIEMLCFWHSKSIEVIDEFLASAPDTEETPERLSAYCEVKNRILEAILFVPTLRSGQVAAKLRAVVAEIDHLSTETVPCSIEEVLHIRDIVKMSAELTKATAPGLLFRYQSFLVQELETVSWHLYGERDYAKHTIFFDRAVGSRCKSADHYYTFFDEQNLPTRARAVLKSLKIDTESGDRLTEKGHTT